MLSRDSGDCRIFAKKLRLTKSSFVDICHIGFPSGIQNAFFSVSNMLIQSSVLTVNDMMAPPDISEYAPVIKGNAAVTSLENFGFAALNSVSQASSTFTGQNVGIKDYRRVKKVLGVACLIATVISVTVTALLIVFRAPLLSLYGVKIIEGDPLSLIALETAEIRIWSKWPPFILIALMNTAAGVLRGLGKSVTSATISFVGTCVFRVVWIFTVFEYFKTLESIYISYGISWLLTGVAFFIAVGIMLRKKIKEQSKLELSTVNG
jgi:Na+-driven multidrug efflux pump